MKFEDIEAYVRQIVALELTERDREIQTSIIEMKAEMNSRGVINSTITLRKLADFFQAEGKARVDLLVRHSVTTIKASPSADPTGDTLKGLRLFTTLASEQVSRLTALHDGAAEPVVATLVSGMPGEIRKVLLDRMQNYVKQGELTVELECKLAVGESKEVLALRPTIYGVGVDLKELWRMTFG